MATFNGTTGADVLPPLATGAADAAGNDTLNGLAGDDTLAGWAGNDILTGGGGADALIGGTISTSGGTGTTAPAGADTANYADSPAGVSIDLGAIGSYTRVAGGITLTLTNTSVGHGGDAEGDYLTGITRLIGSAFADTLLGNGLANNLQGGGGDDILNGARGADTMAGGTGNDLYYADNARDIVTELPGEGRDTVTASIDYTLGDNLENLTLSGGARYGTGNSLNNWIVGTEYSDAINGGGGNDTLVGGGRNDVLTGGAGADTLIGSTISISGSTGTADPQNFPFDVASYATSPAGVTIDLGAVGSYRRTSGGITLTLTDTSVGHGGDAEGDYLTGIDRLIGSAFADRLTGNSGSNNLDGGAGDDILVGGDGEDRYSVDSAGDAVIELPDGLGVDWVFASIDYTLPATVECLVLSGQAIRGTGNALYNSIYGNEENNIIDGRGGGDMLLAYGGNDILIDGAYKRGGSGDDIYSVDNEGDNIFERAEDGHDRVNSSIDYALPSSFEDLSLTGPAACGLGNELANLINGNGQNNIIDGGGGDDWLLGRDGNDTLAGGAGADKLVGGLGADAMAGGAGDDIYSFDNSGDTLTELPGEGRDRINSSIDYVELPDNVEILVLTGGAMFAYGNDLDNVMSATDRGSSFIGYGGNDLLVGRGGGDLFYGWTGDDRLFGGGGDDTLYGEDDNDSLAGDDGNDWLAGGSGNDSLTGGTGNDALSGNNGNDSLSGGDGNDRLVGGEANDYLLGGNGSDRLGGYTGADTFAFEALGAGADRILDFEDGIDHIELARAGFGIGPGAVNVVNAASSAGITGDAIFYQTTTGSLFWHDGETVADTLFATLDNLPAALDSTDFVLV